MYGHIVYVDSGVQGEKSRKAYAKNGKCAGFVRDVVAYARADARRVFISVRLKNGGTASFRSDDLVFLVDQIDDSVDQIDDSWCRIGLSNGSDLWADCSASDVRDLIRNGYAAIDERLGLEVAQKIVDDSMSKQDESSKLVADTIKKMGEVESKSSDLEHEMNQQMTTVTMETTFGIRVSDVADKHELKTTSCFFNYTPQELISYLPEPEASVLSRLFAAHLVEWRQSARQGDQSCQEQRN